MWQIILSLILTLSCFFFRSHGQHVWTNCPCYASTIHNYWKWTIIKHLISNRVSEWLSERWLSGASLHSRGAFKYHFCPQKHPKISILSYKKVHYPQSPLGGILCDTEPGLLGYLELAQPIIKLEEPQIKIPRPRPMDLMTGTAAKLPAEKWSASIISTTLDLVSWTTSHMTWITCSPNDSTEHRKRVELGRLERHVSHHGHNPHSCTEYPLEKQTWKTQQGQIRAAF